MVADSNLQSKGISVDETEWLDAPFMSWDGLSEDGMSEDGMYEDGMSEDGMSRDEMSEDGGFGASTDRHFLRIPIKNVVSLDRRFGVSVPMTSILTFVVEVSPSQEASERSNWFN